jgi:hypothetical protein
MNLVQFAANDSAAEKGSELVSPPPLKAAKTLEIMSALKGLGV